MSIKVSIFRMSIYVPVLSRLIFFFSFVTRLLESDLDVLDLKFEFFESVVLSLLGWVNEICLEGLFICCIVLAE